MATRANSTPAFTPTLSRCHVLPFAAAALFAGSAAQPSAPSPLPDESKLTTLEDYQTATFEPWQHTDGEWQPPTNHALAEEMGIVTLRIAWFTLYKIKAELVEIAEGLWSDDDPNLLMELADNIRNLKSMHSDIMTMLNTADLRLLVACSSSPKIMATQNV